MTIKVDFKKSIEIIQNLQKLNNLPNNLKRNESRIHVQVILI